MSPCFKECTDLDAGCNLMKSGDLETEKYAKLVPILSLKSKVICIMVELGPEKKLGRKSMDFPFALLLPL